MLQHRSSMPVDTINGIPVLRPTGRLDAYQIPALDATMEAIFATTSIPQIIVNFMYVQFIDAAALATLNKWRMLVQEQGGDIKLSALRQTVWIQLGVHHLASYEMYPDDEQAAAAFCKGNG